MKELVSRLNKDFFMSQDAAQKLAAISVLKTLEKGEGFVKENYIKYTN